MTSYGSTGDVEGWRKPALGQASIPPAAQGSEEHGTRRSVSREELHEQVLHLLRLYKRLEDTKAQIHSKTEALAQVAEGPLDDILGGISALSELLSGLQAGKAQVDSARMHLHAMHLILEDAINAFDLGCRPLTRLEHMAVRVLRRCVRASHFIRRSREERAAWLELCLDFDSVDRALERTSVHAPSTRKKGLQGKTSWEMRRARATFASEMIRRRRQQRTAWRRGTHTQQLAEHEIDAFYCKNVPRAIKFFELMGAEQRQEPGDCIKAYEKAHRYFSGTLPDLGAKGLKERASDALKESFRNAKAALEQAALEYNMFLCSRTWEYDLMHSILRETLEDGEAHSVILSYKGDVLAKALEKARDEWLEVRNKVFCIGQGPFAESEMFDGGHEINLARLDLEIEHVKCHLQDHMHGSASRWFVRGKIAAMATEEAVAVVQAFLNGIPEDATSEASTTVPEMWAWERENDFVKLGESCAGGMRTPSKYMSRMLRQHQEASEKLRKEVARMRSEAEEAVKPGPS